MIKISFLIAAILFTKTTNGTVIEKVGNDIEIETMDGNIWKYEEEKTNLKINDKCMVIFLKNNTKKTTDDVILSIYKKY